MMFFFKSVIPIIACLVFTGCSISNKNPQKTVIQWDRWNVPHIEASSIDSLFFAFGYAQMKLHANSILKMYGECRARGAEYWGKKYLQNDLLYRRLNIPERSEEWLNAQTPEFRSNIISFVDGMNKFCMENPEEITEENKIVLPLKTTDPFDHLQVSYHLNVGAYALRAQMSQWKNAGSNAIAIGPSKSESGNAMMIIQPHPPWMDYYKFLEVHLKSGDLNVYGITLVGQPIIAMGFNLNLGWGLTFNQADAFDVFDIELQDDQYSVGNVDYTLSVRDEEIKIKENGGMTIQTIQCKESIHGPVIEERDGHALAIRISGLDRPFMFEQFFKMAFASNKSEFEEALEMLQLPLQNIVYADKEGNISYVYNGIIPVRPENSNIDWNRILNGNDPSVRIAGYLSYEKLPKFENPSSGFISNSNNPPWHSTIPSAINTANYPAYIAPEFLDLRSQGALREIMAREKFKFEDLLEFQNTSKSELSMRCLEELIYFAKASEDTLLQLAGKVFEDWDRECRPQSKGAVLFNQWREMSRDNLFQNPWDPADPVNTPYELTESAMNNLLAAAQQTIAQYDRLDISWGEVYKIRYNGSEIPSSVGLNELGSFQAGFYMPGQNGSYQLLGGVAYSLVVEFADKIKTKALLPYGNSSQHPSADQLELLSEGKLREVYFDLEAGDVVDREYPESE